MRRIGRRKSRRRQGVRGAGIRKRIPFHKRIFLACAGAVAALVAPTVAALLGASAAVVLGLLALGLVASVIATRYLTRAWSTPIKELERAANEFDAKNFAHRVHVEDPPELREVASALNSMAGDAEDNREEMLHEQRMRMIGQLAAGVAHDFNNLLTSILTATTLIRDRVEDEVVREDLQTIAESGERGAELVKQLLIYGRKNVANPEPVDLSAVVLRMERLLERTLGENIELHLDLTPGLGPVETDPAQISQVVMNLVLNARDAISGSGKVTIATSETQVPREIDAGATGSHVKFEVIDSGAGIPEEIRDRVFEPFFTTKSRSQGTGLGLSTVQATVERYHGAIALTSRVGEGTRIAVFLPTTDRTIELPEGEEPSREQGAGGGRLLVVEDDAKVLKALKRMLDSSGYEVLTARSAAEAMSVLESVYGDVDLMLTDVVMPGDSGPALAEQIYLRWTELPVLYMTGYGTEILERHKVARDAQILFKPFSREELVEAIGSTARRDPIAPSIRDRLRLE